VLLTLGLGLGEGDNLSAARLGHVGGWWGCGGGS
jgi:hypothetical protein